MASLLRYAHRLVVAVPLGLALVVFMIGAAGPKSPMSLEDRRNVNRLLDAIISYGLRSDKASPTVSVDRIVEHLHAGTLSVRSYEHFDRAAPAAVLNGLRLRLEAGLELPWHADDLLVAPVIENDGNF
jgi:hypothetical protein